MSSIKIFVLTIVIMVTTTSGAFCGDRILVLEFDCRGKARNLSGPLADSLTANLGILDVPVVSRNAWTSLLGREGYSENDLNYNFARLSRLAESLE